MSEAPARTRFSPLARLFAAANGIFILTVLMMVVTGFQARPQALARFLDDYGLKLLAVEVGVILALAVILMAAERRATVRALEKREAELLQQAFEAAAAARSNGRDGRPNAIAFDELEQAIRTEAQSEFGVERQIDVHVDRETREPSISVDGRAIPKEKIGELIGRVAAAKAREVIIQKIGEIDQKLGEIETSKDQ
jgi:hypothetical protein